MKKLPPNTNKVEQGHKCDVCQVADAKYYNLTWYIHICSIECFEMFIQLYNKEIDDLVLGKLQADDQIKDQK